MSPSIYDLGIDKLSVQDRLRLSAVTGKGLPALIAAIWHELEALKNPAAVAD